MHSFKSYICIILILFSLSILEVNAQTPPDTGINGAVWFVPHDNVVFLGDSFATEIHLNSGSQMFAAYGIDISFEPSIMEYDEYLGYSAGSEGFVSVVNANEPGIVKTTGFDAVGKGPGADLHALTLNWLSLAAGETILEMTINDLADNNLNTIGVPTANNGRVFVIINPDPFPKPNKRIHGSMWFAPYNHIAFPDNKFALEVHLNSGAQIFGAYGVDISYNPAILEYINYSVGAQGFVSAVNGTTPGIVKTSGFDAAGKGPGPELHVLSIHWTGIGIGETEIGMTINDLADTSFETIGVPTANNGKVIVVGPPDTSAVGALWFVPLDQTVSRGSFFTTEVHINTGTKSISSYNMSISFDPDIIHYESYFTDIPGQVFLSTIIPDNVNGNIIVTGFDAAGKTPGTDLYIYRINWVARGMGETVLNMIINSMLDKNNMTIGVPAANDGRVVVSTPVDAEKDFAYTTSTGKPGDVSGDNNINIQDSLIIAQLYVKVIDDLPFFRFQSQWKEVHIPFTEMTQESFDVMYYVDKDNALESVKAFEVDFHSKNNNEQGTVWIDDVAIYRDNPTGYREYYTIGNYDEFTPGGAWSGGRYYVYNDSGGVTPAATIEGAVEAGGPSGSGNCLKVIYNLGGHHDDGSGHDVTSLGVGLDIIYGNPSKPPEVPLGKYLVADVRSFDGIRFWIKLQKGVGTTEGFGDEPDEKTPGECLGGYMMRCRLKSADQVISNPQMFNYFGINLDM